MNMIRLALILLLIPLTVNCQQAPSTVTAAQISEIAHFLSNDQMKGRRNGSPEMMAAAGYIAGHFKEAGLQPAPGLSSFFQSYSFETRRSGSIEENNVIGYLEGSDPELKKEYLIFSAHFDHVGIGRAVDGDSIYNGANDNAAGTATLIALAHSLLGQKIKPKRSIIFAAFSGEEMGLRGSRFFLENCPFPKEKIFLNFNFEMTGHCTILGEKRYYITGPSYTNFDEILDAYNKDETWQRVDTIAMADRLLFASDNAAFAIERANGSTSLNIPAHTICTHGGEDHIHRPHDEPGFMNYENMADLVAYLAELTQYLGAMEAGSIQWDHEAFAESLKR